MRGKSVAYDILRRRQRAQSHSRCSEVESSPGADVRPPRSDSSVLAAAGRATTPRWEASPRWSLLASSPGSLSARSSCSARASTRGRLKARRSLARSFHAPSSLHAAARTAACAVAAAAGRDVGPRRAFPDAQLPRARGKQGRRRRGLQHRRHRMGAARRRLQEAVRAASGDRCAPYASTHACAGRSGRSRVGRVRVRDGIHRALADDAGMGPAAFRLVACLPAASSTCTSSRGPRSPSCLRSTNSRRSRQRAPAPSPRCSWRWRPHSSPSRRSKKPAGAALPRRAAQGSPRSVACPFAVAGIALAR